MLRLFVIIYFVTPVFGKSNFCETDADCDVNNGITCQNGLCSCGPWKVFSTEGDKCLDIAPTIGSNCVDTAQCTALISGPTICDAREMCACAEGYVYVNNQCVRYRGYNETCGEDIPCFDGVDLFALTCSTDKRCSCTEGYYNRGVGCRPTAKANDGECFFDIDCENSNQYCKFNLINWGPIGKCTDVPTKLCLTDKNCENLQNSYCDKNIKKCRCENGYDYDKTNNICVPEKTTAKMVKNIETLKDDPTIDITCETDNNCKKISNSFCPDFRKKCTCKQGYIFSKSTGHCVKALGSTCEENNECGVRHSVCENGHCQCPKFFIYSPYYNKCFKPTREYNLHSCGSDENCYSFGPFATCIRANEKAITSTCNCKSSSQYNSALKYCEPVNSGQQCKNDCRDKPHSKCIGVECKCDEHYLDEDGLKCLPDLGYSCSLKENDCVIPYAECVKVDNNNICQCKNGTIQTDIRECLKEITSPEEECVSNKQCSNYLGVGGICTNNTCSCQDEYIFDDRLHKCELIKSFGDTCASRRQCNLLGNWNHVTCRNGVCVCEYGYKFSEEVNDCVNGANTITQSIFFLVILLAFVIF